MTSLTRKPSRLRENRREVIVARMLDVVEELLVDGRTYTELSVEQLIKSAGIARSTFYVYFEDKGALLLALAEDVSSQIFEAGQAWWTLSPDADEGDLERALRGLTDVYVAHARIWDSLVDAASYDPNVRKRYRELVGSGITEIAKHIRDGQKKGYVREGLDPVRTAGWLGWMCERGLYQLMPEASKAEITRLSKAQTAIIWQTLYAGSKSRR